MKDFEKRPKRMLIGTEEMQISFNCYHPKIPTDYTYTGSGMPNKLV